MGPREKFILSANKGKILASKCLKCGHAMLETVYFCDKCFGSKFES
ncbi:MAG TPA: zinc ribbon domain-containing protein, partial [Nitrososphaeraceae archaeon]